MPTVVARTLISQEFDQVPVFSNQPLTACIIGPQYNLYRYGVAAEKPYTAVTNPTDVTLGNIYQSGSDVVYNLPNQVPGTLVDASYTKVFIDKAEVEYYPSVLGSTSGAVSRIAVPNVSGKYYPNRFLASALIFQTANGSTRSPEFSNRDVQIGDVVYLASTTDNLTARVRIKSLYATQTASSLGTVTTDVGNLATAAGSHNGTVTQTVSGGSSVSVANTSTAYVGNFNYLSGAAITSDTYIATVTTGGDLTAVRFSVASANGAFATKTSVALASAVLTLDNANSNSLLLDFTGSTAFTVGDEFSISVVATVNAAIVPTAGGTYKGTSNLNYKLTVVRSGPFYDPTANSGAGNASICARIAITSDNIDSSATVNVQSGTAFAVGSYGVTATFSAGPIQGGLVVGDAYYIPATAATNGAVNIVETYESLPANFVAGTSTDYKVSSMVLVTNLSISEAVANDSVDLNWTVDATNQTITINSGIVATDPNIGIAGVPINLNVTTGQIFVEHRDLVLTNINGISSVGSSDVVAATLGTIDPDNPLAQGVFDAALNAAGVPVYYIAVGSDDLTGYTAALTVAERTTSAYGIAPLTADTSIQQAVIGHVNSLSVPEKAKWRTAWIQARHDLTTLLYNLKSDGSNWTGTITDDPITNGTQYTLLTVAGATFITDDVRANDLVQINFRNDSTGEVIYDTYKVASVRTETTLALVAGPAAAINSPTKVQIVRVYTTDEQIANLSAQASGYNNRRVRCVFPGTTKNGSVVKPGYFLCAALAGLRSGTVPHQGLTNTEVLGFTDVSDALLTFTSDQLDTLAAAGTYIVTQDAVGATPYVRQQLTTDMSSLNKAEESYCTNTDSISFGLMSVLAPFEGRYNVYKKAIELIRQAINTELRFRMTQTATDRAGNQLNSYSIDVLEQSPTFKDRLVAQISLDEPAPLNESDITLIVG